MNDKITALYQTNMTPKHYIKRCKQQTWKTVKLTSFQKPQLQYVSVLFFCWTSLSFPVSFCTCIMYLTTGFNIFFSWFDLTGFVSQSEKWTPFPTLCTIILSKSKKVSSPAPASNSDWIIWREFPLAAWWSGVRPSLSCSLQADGFCLINCPTTHVKPSRHAWKIKDANLFHSMVFQDG